MRTAVAVLLVCGVFAARVQAAEFTPARGLGALDLDFDTMDGHFSLFELNDLCALNAVRFTLTPLRFGADKTWAPGIMVHLQSKDATATLAFSSIDKKTLNLTTRYAKAGSKDRREDLIPNVQVALNQKIDIAVDWSPSGEVTFKAGAFSTQFQIGGPPTAFRISGSTSEMHLLPFSAGYTGPQPDCAAKP